MDTYYFLGTDLRADAHLRELGPGRVSGPDLVPHCFHKQGLLIASSDSVIFTMLPRTAS